MTAVIRAVVVDDVELARQKLARALGAHPDVEIVGEAANGEDMVAAIAALSPALVFLDIALPEQDGFSALSEVPPERRPLVIFLTAYAHYALDAFRVEAVDYLLKPVVPELLAQALQRVRRRLRAPRPELALPAAPTATYPERLTVRTDSGLRVLAVDAIHWVEALRNYLAFHCAGETVIVRSTLQGVLGQLDPARFARVHRSAIVNLRAVRELRAASSGNQRLLLHDGTALAISRTHREALLRLLAG
jgi:two-component system, LytTR family, response regulator